MKKWVILVAAVSMLAGCGQKENAKTEESKQAEETTTSSATSESKKEEKPKKVVELKEDTLQIGDTPYKISYPKDWEREVEEDGLSVQGTKEDIGLVVYGMKKTDFESYEAFKNIITESLIANEDEEGVQLKEEDITKEVTQTPHYVGDLYQFTMPIEGVKAEIHHYFLETETDYAVVIFSALPSYYEKNKDLETRIVHSFQAVTE